MPNSASEALKELVLIGLAFVVVVFGQEASAADTLREALEKAYLYNPSLEAVRAQSRAVDESVPQALAGFQPDLSATGEGTKSRISRRPSLSTFDRNRRPWSAGVVATVNVYQGGGTVASVAQAENQVKAQRARLLDTEQQILLAAVSAYLDVLRDQDIREISRRNLEVLEQSLAATIRRREAQQVTQTDVAQARSRVARAQADLELAEGSLNNSRARFQNIVGEAPGVLGQVPAAENLPDTLSSAIAMATTRAPSVVAAGYDLRAARDAVDVEFSDLLPSVDLEGSVNRSDNGLDNNVRTDDYSVTARLTVPLFPTAGPYSQVRQAKQTAGAQRRLLDQALNDSREIAVSAWENLRTARARTRSIAAESEAANLALEGVRREAQAGFRTTIEVLDAEQDAFTARVNLVAAQSDEVFFTYALKSAIGDLTAQKLGLNVPIYDPRAYYDSVRDKWIGTGSDTEDN